MSSTPQKGLLLGLAGALLVFGLRSISKILVSGQTWVVLRKTLGLCWGSNISQSLWSGQYLLLCGFISEGEKRHTTFPAQVATLQSWVRSENTASHSYTPPSLLQDSFFPISSLQGPQSTLNFAGFHGGKFYVAVPAPISFPLLAGRTPPVLLGSSPIFLISPSLNNPVWFYNIFLSP